MSKSRKTQKVGVISGIDLLTNRKGKVNPVQNPEAFAGCNVVYKNRKAYNRNNDKRDAQKIKDDYLRKIC
jgi:hypothetical protein